MSKKFEHRCESIAVWTPIEPLVLQLLASVPEPYHTGVAFYREWRGTMPDGLSAEGEDDSFSVSWVDGELCLCVSQLDRYLRESEREVGEKTAMECHRELLGILTGLVDKSGTERLSGTRQ